MKTAHDFECDVIVIGAGVIGLAVARKLQLEGRDVILLERNDAFGMETSSRNSEVIHAGIYYPAGSLKAFHCVQGKQMLYAYAKERSIPHQQIGKLIVASQEDELNKLDAYIESARANGVDDLRRISQAELKELEPEVQAFGAVFSPSSGIIDSHALMLSLLGDFENAGGNFIVNSPVVSGRSVSNGIQIQLGDADQSLILAKTVINAAGLYACDVARSIEGIRESAIPKPYYAIGHYFTIEWQESIQAFDLSSGGSWLPGCSCHFGYGCVKLDSDLTLNGSILLTTPLMILVANVSLMQSLAITQPC